MWSVLVGMNLLLYCLHIYYHQLLSVYHVLVFNHTHSLSIVIHDCLVLCILLLSPLLMWDITSVFPTILIVVSYHRKYHHHHDCRQHHRFHHHYIVYSQYLHFHHHYSLIVSIIITITIIMIMILWKHDTLVCKLAHKERLDDYFLRQLVKQANTRLNYEKPNRNGKDIANLQCAKNHWGCHVALLW